MLFTSQIGFVIALTDVEATLKQRWDNVTSALNNVETMGKGCIEVVQCFSTLDTDVLSTRQYEGNSTSDFVPFSASDQRYFKVDLQRWKDVDLTLKYWLGNLLSITHHCWNKPYIWAQIFFYQPFNTLKYSLFTFPLEGFES